jgi:hypothetical protein
VEQAQWSRGGGRVRREKVAGDGVMGLRANADAAALELGADQVMEVVGGEGVGPFCRGPLADDIVGG